MWEAINKVLDFFLKLIGRKLEGKESKEVFFLRERKELRESQVWLLDILEIGDKFNTYELFEIWEPLMIERTGRPEEDFSVDGIFSRLEELKEIGFISKEKIRGKTMWQLSSSYLENFIPRNSDMTIVNK